MTTASIAQLAIILAPMLKDLTIEGSKIIATYREDLNQEQIDHSLTLSKSTNWPELDFERTGAK